MIFEWTLIVILAGNQAASGAGFTMPMTDRSSCEFRRAQVESLYRGEVDTAMCVRTPKP